VSALAALATDSPVAVVSLAPRGQLVRVVVDPAGRDADGAERVAQAWLKKRLMRRWQGRDLIPVESCLAPVDFSYQGGDLVRRGAWIVVCKVFDPQRWRVLLASYPGLVEPRSA
jgi:hypothetical protein